MANVDVRLLSLSNFSPSDEFSSPFIRLLSVVDEKFVVDSDAVDLGDKKGPASSTIITWKHEILPDIPVLASRPQIKVQLMNKDAVLGDSVIAQSASAQQSPVLVFAEGTKIVCGVPHDLSVALDNGAVVHLRAIADDFGEEVDDDDCVSLPAVCRSRSPAVRAVSVAAAEEEKSDESAKEQQQEEELPQPQPQSSSTHFSPTRVDVTILSADVTSLFATDTDDQDFLVNAFFVSSSPQQQDVLIGSTTVADAIFSKPHVSPRRVFVKWSESFRFHNTESNLDFSALRFELVSRDLFKGDTTVGSAVLSEVPLPGAAAAEKKTTTLAMADGVSLNVRVVLHDDANDALLPPIFRSRTPSPLPPMIDDDEVEETPVQKEQQPQQQVVVEEQPLPSKRKLSRTLLLNESLPDGVIEHEIDDAYLRGKIVISEHAHRRDIEQRWAANASFRSFLHREWHHFCRVQQQEQKEQEQQKQRELVAEKKKRKEEEERQKKEEQQQRVKAQQKIAEDDAPSSPTTNKNSTATASPKSLLRYKKQQEEMQRIRNEFAAKRSIAAAAGNGASAVAASRGGRRAGSKSPPGANGGGGGGAEKNARNSDHYDEAFSSGVMSELRKMINEM